MTAGGNGIKKMRNMVFISYASEKGDSGKSDRQVADMIYSALKSKGINCWVAHQDIAPGLNWPDEISKAISKSRIMVVVVSSNTQNSRYVSREVTQAADENVIIMPFFIEQVLLRGGLKLLLCNCHWINAYPQPQETYLDQLVEAVLNHGIKSGKPIGKERYETEQGKIVVKNVIPGTGEIKEPPDMPEDVKKVISIADKVKKNEKGYWEAYYQDGIIMVYVPPGQFKMGQTKKEKKWLIDNLGEKKYNSWFSNETAIHNIYLDGYWLGKFAVTNAQYVKFLNDLGIDHKNGCQGKQCIVTKQESDRSHIKGKKGNYHIEEDYENHPVIRVSWYGAVEYCNWLSQKIGLQFKLPTEAQWEKAARGSDSRKYPWGNKKPGKNLTNFASDIRSTTPVGSYPEGASPYGLLDMAGNIREWCIDCYSSDYYKNSPLGNLPIPNSDFKRVSRGGGFYDFAWNLRCAKRFSTEPSAHNIDLGFRICQLVSNPLSFPHITPFGTPGTLSFRSGWGQSRM